MATSKSKAVSKPGLAINLEEIKKAAAVLRGLNHKTRQDILNLLDANEGIRVTDIYKKLKKEQSLTSSYLAILRRAGVVTTKRDGQVIYYSVDHKRLAEVEKGARLINSR